MSAQTFEFILARLYTVPDFRSQFLADPIKALADYELTPEEQRELVHIDKAGLVMASNSFLSKRKKAPPKRKPMHRLWALIGVRK